MNIKVVKEINFSELEEKIRKVPLLQKRNDSFEIYVYKEARISLRELDPEEVNPTTFYLLRSGLEFQRKLRKKLLEQDNIDTLHLTSAYELENEKKEIWTIMPPIIEVTQRVIKYQSKEHELTYDLPVNIKIPIINDGAHRVFIAREEGLSFKGIYISKILEEFPFYAHPNEWERVKIVETIPKTKEEKKFYSRENCYALYRNFDVLGCGKPRGTSV